MQCFLAYANASVTDKAVMADTMYAQVWLYCELPTIATVSERWCIVCGSSREVVAIVVVL